MYHPQVPAQYLTDTVLLVRALAVNAHSGESRVIEVNHAANWATDDKPEPLHNGVVGAVLVITHREKRES